MKIVQCELDYIEYIIGIKSNRRSFMPLLYFLDQNKFQPYKMGRAYGSRKYS
jgi:hypothetical protein